MYSQSGWNILSWHMCMCKLCQCVCFCLCHLFGHLKYNEWGVEWMNSSQAGIGWRSIFTSIVNHPEFNHQLEGISSGEQQNKPWLLMRKQAADPASEIGMNHFCRWQTFSFSFTKHFDSKAKHDFSVSSSSHGISERISGQNLWMRSGCFQK